MSTSKPTGTHRDALDLFKGLLFNILGMLLKLGKVLFVYVAVHFYSPSALGLYFIGWNVVDMLSKLGLWGSDKLVVREIARLRGSDSPQQNRELGSIIAYAAWKSALLSMGVAALIFVLSPWVANHIFSDPNLIVPLRLLALATPFIVLTLVFIATTKALRLMQYEAFIRQGLEPAMLLVATVALIPFHLDATGLALAHLTASIIACSAAFSVMLKKFALQKGGKPTLPPAVRKKYWAYTTPIAATDFVNLAVARSDVLLVGAFLNATSAGYYGIAVEIISVIKRIRQSFEPIFAPIVAELFHSGQQNRLKRNYQIVTRWLLAGSFLPAVVIILFAEPILSFFNVSSVPTVWALRILALAHGLFGTFSAAESLLVMTGRSLLNFLLGSAMLVLNVTLGLLLIPRIGLVGAALSTLAAFLFVSFARIYQGYRLMHLTPFGRRLVWPLATAMLTSLVVWGAKFFLPGTSPIQIGMLFLLTVLLYLGLYFSGARMPEELFLRDKILAQWRRLSTRVVGKNREFKNAEVQK
ncbi:MAG: flippase [Calditrichaeota bacterium]|nr:MAG: flippase [Calditrichota bacterium]